MKNFTCKMTTYAKIHFKGTYFGKYMKLIKREKN